MNREERGPWYLITALVIGVGAGLFYAWVLAPVTYIDIAPVSLEENYKEQYRALIAAAYAANNDLARARSRLEQLEDPDIIRTLTMQAQRSLVITGQEAISHSLGLLALALEQDMPAAQPVEANPPAGESSSSPTEEPADSPTEPPISFHPTESPSQAPGTFNISNLIPTNQPTSTILPSITPLTTRTPTSTPSVPFILSKEASLICNPRQTRPLIIVEAYDTSGIPIPGLEILVQWIGGEDRFYTGLKFEKGLGYADYTMTPGITYTVQMAEGGQIIQGLTASECQVSGSNEAYWGSWKVVYEQR